MRSMVSRLVLDRLALGRCANRSCPGYHAQCSPFCDVCAGWLDTRLGRCCWQEWQLVLAQPFTGTRTRWYGQFLVCVQYVEVCSRRVPGAEFRDAVSRARGEVFA